MPSIPSALHVAVLDWYDDHARELPWRGVEASPWSVMVSEFMLQQTPVARVLPVHAAWLERWPTPADLAAESTGEAVRMWGRLGYPRRALRLHAAAVAIVERHDGEVPASYDDLLALPGVGDYTASAIASFAFGQRHVVLDTNVRRVLARVGVRGGVPRARGHPRRARRGDRAAARRRGDRRDLGGGDDGARRAGVHRAPAVVRRLPGRRPTCAWRGAGFPAYDGPPRRGQAWAGTDRQCRGRIMALAREARRRSRPAAGRGRLARRRAARAVPGRTRRRRPADADHPGALGAPGVIW